MKRKLIIILLSLLPIRAFADRYIEASEGSSSGGFFDVIIGIGLSITAIFYFYNSFELWKIRHTNNEKPKQMDGIGDWILHLIGYAFVSIFTSFAILLILKIIAGPTFVRDYWNWIFLSFFGLLVFLKRT